jgi:gliding motility-associated-like protein
VVLKDANGCPGTVQSFQIVSPFTASSIVFTNTMVTCFGGNNGAASAITTNGTAPFTYTWSTGSNNPIINNLTQGNYTVTIKDAGGCIVTKTTQITQPSTQLTLNFTIIKPTCNTADGSIVANATGGALPYSYTWLPIISTTATLNAIPAGAYSLALGEGNGCITNTIVNVLASVVMSISANTKPENCSAVDGAFTINIIGGNMPYSYTTTPIGPHASNTIGGLTSGGYTTIVTDGNNCKDSLKFFISNLSTVALSVINTTQVSCFQGCNGAVAINAVNAISPITYSASGSPTTNLNVIKNLCAGFYTIKATDNIGCAATLTINFPSPPAFSFSAANVPQVCQGKQVTLQGSAIGGTAPYVFKWEPGNLSGQVVIFSPTASAVYSLNVFDANGCTLASKQVSVNVAEPLAINLGTAATGICSGSTAQITPTVSGGDGNYVFNWLPGNKNSQNLFVENISVPVYTLNVNDGCGSPTAVKIVTINLFPVTIPKFTSMNDSGCQPLCTSFLNTTFKSKKMFWNFGDGPNELEGDDITYCYPRNGIFNVRLTVTDSNWCRSSFTYSNVVTVLQSPTADYITVPERVTLNNADNVLIKNATPNATFLYWNINGFLYNFQDEINYNFNDTGCYFVQLIAQNQNNCFDTLQRNICVIEGFNFYMPNAFSPNNDALNELVKPIGTGWLNNDYLYEVYNRWGQRVYKTTDKNEGWDGKTNDTKYDVSGIYQWRALVTDNLLTRHELKGHFILLR